MTSNVWTAGRPGPRLLSVAPTVTVADSAERPVTVKVPPDSADTRATSARFDRGVVYESRSPFAQVLNNLFSNAARPAPESTPIRVAAVREDRNQ